MSGAGDARRGGVPDEVYRLSLTADALSLRELTGWLAEMLAATGIQAPSLQARTELAVHEVCMNVIDHAYAPRGETSLGAIDVEGTVDDDAVLIVVRDTGAPFDPEQVRLPIAGVPQIGGYGLLIAGKLADGLTYQREDGTNIWSLLFTRARKYQEKTS